MGENKGYHAEPFGLNRRLVAAASAINAEKHTIHLITEADVTTARRIIAAHRAHTGERLSLTAYVVACLARTFDSFPKFNAFRQGGRLIVLEDLTVSVLFEREIDGENVPEPVGIQAANRKTFRQINDELRAAQQHAGKPLGAATGMAWVRFMPGILLRTFIRLASRNIAMQKRYGVAGVTAVGMFGAGPLWIVPLSSATVTVAVGTIAPRMACVDGVAQEREYLCLTLSFDHDIVDGAPAARFTSLFTQQLASGAELHTCAGQTLAPSENKAAR
jgi:pyruvate/2-oxoglutarate dehydrogenase complex dihydrolipoamide acyltransferase (E2) component